MTNGADLVARLTMKPISTLAKPLASVNMRTKKAEKADFERSDVCAVPAGSVIGEALGPGQMLDECLKPGQELRAAYDSDPFCKEIVDLARPLEGLVRQDSIHAAGVVIGAQPLMDVVPLQQKGADQEVVTQFPMGDVERLGLLKMDFLGLRNLDVIDTAVELIGDLNISQVALDDAKTYAMLARATRPASSSSSPRACATPCARSSRPCSKT